MTLDEARQHIGAGVTYEPYPGARREDGDIVAVTTHYVMVRYRGDRGAKATSPAQLTLLMGEQR